MTGILIVGGLAAILVIYLMIRKDAGDAREGKAAKEALKDVTDANRPVAEPERERVRQKYQRD